MKNSNNLTPVKYFLAVDIGASNGRHILGWIEDGIIKLEEVHRFPNGMEKVNSSLVWDVEALFSEIITGMKKCADIGKLPCSIGIDTWGVDFVLIDENGQVTAPTIAYRDSRTEGMYEETFNNHMSESDLYERTGIQKQPFNTIFQLMAIKTKNPEYFSNAKHMLFMPDYLHYKLCGAIKTEYTIASTTGLLNAKSKTWDDEIIKACGFPRSIFCELVPAGTKLGHLTADVKKPVGYDCEVVMPTSHDTASAFLAVPTKSDNAVYISSGTWSLMGVELSEPILTKESRDANMSNEGGYDYSYRYLKNIMGLWMIQSVHKEIGEGKSFEEIAKMARQSEYNGIVDVNDNRFYAPDSMVDAIRLVCRENGFNEPETIGDIARCNYRSLAHSYAQTVKELEVLTGKQFDSINIIGGGSNNAFLNELTAQTCELPVYAGPGEGTALGNLVSQMICFGELNGVDDARRVIRHSFDISYIKF